MHSFVVISLYWLTCINRRPYDLCCVGGDVKPCSINQSLLVTLMI